MSDPRRRSNDIPAGEGHVRSQQVKVILDSRWWSYQIPGEAHVKDNQTNLVIDNDINKQYTSSTISQHVPNI